MKNLKNENAYFIIWGSCIVVLLMVCYFGFNVSMSGVSTAFGDVTAVIRPYKVTYSSNWPDDREDEEYSEDAEIEYIILDNMFSVPFGYEFAGWNTSSDGTGNQYKGKSEITLTEKIYLYAQWNKISVSAVYGDVNQNGEIDSDDYLLIENHASGISILKDQALLNADVNEDGIVDDIDADIVKQAYLGTEGYVDYLPSKPILIYEKYGDNSGENEEDSDNNENDGSNGDSQGTGSSGGSGTGTTGSGNAASGNGQGNSSSNGGNGTGSGSNSNGNTSNSNQNNSSSLDTENDSKNEIDDSEEVVDDTTKVTYEFKFMNGDKEYATTKCDALEDTTCELVLPENNPTKKGYIFSGWSLTKNCPTGNGINSPVIVNSSNTYYACFIEKDEGNNSNKGLYAGIVVFALCVMATRVIWHLVYRFKKEQESISDSEQSGDDI